MRVVWFLVGCAGLALGVAGVFLPLLPATPFLLIAAFLLSHWAGIGATYLAIQALALTGAAAFVFSRPSPPQK